jgi:EmrB/QacA subfamily drug resistance transporter
MPTLAAPNPRRWWILGVLCLSLLIISLDNTILNVALPTLARDLDASGSQLQWMVDAYVLVFAGLLLTMGSLGDRYGRKLALNAGFAIFGLGSVLAAWSGSAEALIATRTLMGVGGALIMPSTLSILTNVFPPLERGKAIAIWAATAGLGIPLGPVLGGWLLEHYWWGSVFLINVPIIIVAFLAGWVLIPESRDPDASPLDPLGAVLSIAGLATLLYAIIEAPDRGWTDGLILAAFAASAVLLTAFALWEWRNPRPMLNMAFFRNPRFTGASLAIALVFFALFGSMFFLTQYLQFVRGYSALSAGLRIVPVAIGIMAGTGLSTRITPRFGTKAAVAGGMVVVAGGLFWLSTLTLTSDYWRLCVGLIVLGFGMGNAMAPATDSIMGSLPRENAGVGSAMNDTNRQVGGALGVAILGSLLASSYQSSMESATRGMPSDAAAAAGDSIGAAVRVAATLGGPQGAALLEAARVSFVDAMSTTIIIGSVIALAGALVALLILPSHEPEHAEDESEVATAPATREQATAAPR